MYCSECGLLIVGLCRDCGNPLRSPGSTKQLSRLNTTTFLSGAGHTQPVKMHNLLKIWYTSCTGQCTNVRKEEENAALSFFSFIVISVVKKSPLNWQCQSLYQSVRLFIFIYWSPNWLSEELNKLVIQSRTMCLDFIKLLALRARRFLFPLWKYRNAFHMGYSHKFITAKLIYLCVCVSMYVELVDTLSCICTGY